MNEIKPTIVSYVHINELFDLLGTTDDDREQILSGRLNDKVTWGETDLALITFDRLFHIIGSSQSRIEQRFHAGLLEYSLLFDTKELFVNLQ